jgi:hypothetical protein
MSTTQPPSPTTAWSAIRAAAGKLESLGLAQKLLRIAPGLPAAAVAGVAILFFAWSCEHGARQREAAKAQQAKKQAAEQISELQKQAASAVRQAQQSSQAAKELEGKRQQLARDADGLRQSLDSLRNQELVRASELAGLNTEEVVKRVTARLQEQGTGNRGQGTEPATEAGNQGSQKRGQDARATAGETPAPQAAAAQAALVLSDEGVRKVESAFVQLDACRQQSQVIAQQVSNCDQRAKLDSALEEQQAEAISKLNAALADKDQILARSETAHRAELKAVRGTWRTRFCHAVEIFAGGFIAGVLVR